MVDAGDTSGCLTHSIDEIVPIFIRSALSPISNIGGGPPAIPCDSTSEALPWSSLGMAAFSGDIDMPRMFGEARQQRCYLGSYPVRCLCPTAEAVPTSLCRRRNTSTIVTRFIEHSSMRVVDRRERHGCGPFSNLRADR